MATLIENLIEPLNSIKNKYYSNSKYIAISGVIGEDDDIIRLN